MRLSLAVLNKASAATDGPHHRAAYPAGEQTATFDTTQGGALVSPAVRLRPAADGHSQPDERCLDGDYNPTQAGNESANSQVTGIM